MLVEGLEVLLDPRRRLHLAASIGQPFLLTRFDPERVNLANREIEPLAVAIRLGQRLARIGEFAFQRASSHPGRFDRAGVELAEGV